MAPKVLGWLSLEHLKPSHFMVGPSAALASLPWKLIPGASALCAPPHTSSNILGFVTPLHLVSHFPFAPSRLNTTYCSYWCPELVLQLGCPPAGQGVCIIYICIITTITTFAEWMTHEHLQHFFGGHSPQGRYRGISTWIRLAGSGVAFYFKNLKVN